MLHLNVRNQGETYFISPQIASSRDLCEDLFDLSWLAAQGMIEGSAQGRAAAWFIRIGDEHLVLRHYRRGGLPAKFSDDQFLWTGLRKSRPWRELSVLSQLHVLGLPVPVPVAGRISKKSATYTADIVTERIRYARSLADFLSDGELRDSHDQTHSDQVWHETGRVIREFHDAGAHHADLNVRNILVNAQGGVSLIDWDRGRLGASRRLQARSLTRLRRSLSREATLEAAAQWGWPILMSAYQERC